MTGKAAITQAEIARAISGAIRGGAPIGRIDVDLRRGVVSILPPNTGEAQDDAEVALQDWLRKNGQGRS